MAILHDTEDYLIVDKPYDMYINSDDPNEKNTLANKVGKTDSHLSTSTNFIHFVHRLDYATSGAICLSKNKIAASKAVKLFENRKVKKYYLAMIRGHVTENCDIKFDIGEDKRKLETNHKMIAIVKEEDSTNCLKPRSAYTRLLYLEHGFYEKEPVTLVLLKPFTGRRHQLRVHCSAIGHTIVGDYTYSNGQDSDTYRMFLHSYRLILPLQLHIDVQTEEPFKGDSRFQEKWESQKCFYKHETKFDMDKIIEIIDSLGKIKTFMK